MYHMKNMGLCLFIITTYNHIFLAYSTNCLTIYVARSAIVRAASASLINAMAQVDVHYLCPHQKIIKNRQRKLNKTYTRNKEI